MIFVGTSGWQYDHWRGGFYPRDVAKRRWLEWFAERFATVESNNAFYRLPERKTFGEWRARTPDDFVFAVKMSRYLTHIRRLKDPAEPVARFLDRVAGLEGKLGPVLLQLPPTLRAAPDLLAATLEELPRTVRVAVEPRHVSWWGDEVREALTRHGAALCWADRRSRPVTPLWRTADFGYLRLHQGRLRPGYGAGALTSWVNRIERAFPATHQVYVYFNNDPEGAAPVDAVRFARIAADRGLAVSRTG
ncbi:MAG TPA: DUF72 domain-containing protein [Micromonosporaceae bacterium]